MKREITLTADERRALDALVPRAKQTGDLHQDLTAAARESMRRRVENTDNGGHVLAALHRAAGAWRTIEYVTGIPATTARRWAKRPPGERNEPATEYEGRTDRPDPTPGDDEE